MPRHIHLITAAALLLSVPVPAAARSGDPIKAGRTTKAGNKTTTISSTRRSGAVLKLAVGNGRTTNRKVAPFTTNATGVAKGLNADKVDGLDASQLKGARGPQGPVGPLGPQGPEGPQGPAGSIAGAPAGGVLAGAYPDPTFRLPLALATDALTEPVITAAHANAAGTAPALSGTTASGQAEASGVYGAVTTATPGAYAAGVFGEVTDDGSLGTGVRGEQAGTGYGVYGTSAAGAGVVGESTNGTGLTATSANGNAVFAYTNGPASAVVAQTSSTQPTVKAQSLGTGPAVDAESADPSGLALRVNGGVESGTNGPAFQHTVTIGNKCLVTNAATILDNPQLNNRPDAMLQVTRVAAVSGGNPVGFAHPLSVAYTGAGLITGCPDNRWIVYNDDNTGLTNGMKINVLVIG